MDLKDVEEAARREMAKHGLHDWTFAWARTKRRLGACKYQLKRIEIAEYYARHSPAETVLDTLMHEIAHALAGHAAGHGPKWKAVAVRLGATPRACEKSQQAVVKPGDWQASCSACTKTYHRYKRPKALSGYRCRCPARSPLTFLFQSDPASQPAVPPNIASSANWEATCAGCGSTHLRLRRPKAGVWRCRCPHRCEITWRFRSKTNTPG